MAADVPTRIVTRRQFVTGVAVLPFASFPVQGWRDTALMDDVGRGLRDERNDRLEDETGG